MISFVMRSLSKLCGIFVYNVLMSKLSRCDALHTLVKEFKISIEFLTTRKTINARFPLYTRTILTVVF